MLEKTSSPDDWNTGTGYQTSPSLEVFKNQADRAVLVDSVQCRLQPYFGVEVRLETCRGPFPSTLNKSMKSSCKGYYGPDTGFTVTRSPVPAQDNVQVSLHR